MLYHKVNEHLKIKSQKQNKLSNPLLRKITGAQKLIKELPMAKVRDRRNNKDVGSKQKSICYKDVSPSVYKWRRDAAPIHKNSKIYMETLLLQCGRVLFFTLLSGDCS